eukprot:m51a1_g4716 putative adenylate cyclase (1918) ;mRNA; f:301922-310153
MKRDCAGQKRGERGLERCTLLRHMRVHVTAALLALVGVAAGVGAAAFQYASAAELRALEGRQALEEATLLHGVLDSQLASLSGQVTDFSNWNAVYLYMEEQNPLGPFWALLTQGYAFLELMDLEGAIFVLPNGTMLNGMMWSSNRTYGAPKAVASATLVQQVSSMLLSSGKASGLCLIPETGVLVLVESRSSLMMNGTGADVGWVVFARNVRSLLSRIADMSDLCLDLHAVADPSECSRILRPAWSGRPARMNVGLAADSVSYLVAPSSAFDGVQLACSSAANQTGDTYLAIGTVIGDEAGVPRLHVLIRGLRSDAATVDSMTRYIGIICCIVLGAIMCLVGLLMEVFVLRTLSRLSGKIVDVSENNNAGERLQVAGKTELRNVTRAVNELLAALELRTEQTEHILRSIYPTEVLGRLKRGESNNLTYPIACVLFVDICNFTLWSSALAPSIVTKYLNGLYSEMDDIVHREGATKIMTIVVATGVAEGSSSNCTQTMAAVALKFARLCHGNVMAASEQPLLFRMGIASGSCSCAMIGLRKRFYELWGPSVTLSQQIQESASPGEILVCSETKRALEESARGQLVLEPSGEVGAGAERATAWRLVAPGDTPRTEEVPGSPRTLSSAGLLSLLADDSAILLGSEGTSACTGVLRSLRIGVLAGLAVLLAASVAALVAFLQATLGATTAKLAQARAIADTTRLSYVLRESLTDLVFDADAYAVWDVAVQYVMARDPAGPFWESVFADGSFFKSAGVDGVLYFLPNGTLFSSCGYDYATRTRRDISAAEVSALSAQLLRLDMPWFGTNTGRVFGLLHDPVNNVTRLAASFVVGYSRYTPVEGWVVFLRDLARVLPAKARMMHMCLGVLYSETGTSGPLRGLLVMFAMREPELLAQEKRLSTRLCSIGVAILVSVLGGSVGLMELLVFREKSTIRFRGNDQLLRIAHSVNHLLACRDAQHQKSVELIQSLFPPHVFEVLQKGQLPNESFTAASILFCDIAGFRDWATATAPEEVAAFLGAFIDALDGAAERCGVTKIKTILDIYMAASGVPSETPRHAHAMLKTAVEFHRAARLKAKAQVGTVLCDARTWECAHDEFMFREPQTVQLKGKGLQTVYELTMVVYLGPQSPLCVVAALNGTRRVVFDLRHVGLSTAPEPAVIGPAASVLLFLNRRLSLSRCCPRVTVREHSEGSGDEGPDDVLLRCSPTLTGVLLPVDPLPHGRAVLVAAPMDPNGLLRSLAGLRWADVEPALRQRSVVVAGQPWPAGSLPPDTGPAVLEYRATLADETPQPRDIVDAVTGQLAPLLSGASPCRAASVVLGVAGRGVAVGFRRHEDFDGCARTLNKWFSRAFPPLPDGCVCLSVADVPYVPSAGSLSAEAAADFAVPRFLEAAGGRAERALLALQPPHVCVSVSLALPALGGPCVLPACEWEAPRWFFPVLSVTCEAQGHDLLALYLRLHAPDPRASRLLALDTHARVLPADPRAAERLWCWCACYTGALSVRFDHVGDLDSAVRAADALAWRPRTPRLVVLDSSHSPAALVLALMVGRLPSRWSLIVAVDPSVAWPLSLLRGALRPLLEPWTGVVVADVCSYAAVGSLSGPQALAGHAPLQRYAEWVPCDAALRVPDEELGQAAAAWLRPDCSRAPSWPLVAAGVPVLRRAVVAYMEQAARGGPSSVAMAAGAAPLAEGDPMVDGLLALPKLRIRQRLAGFCAELCCTEPSRYEVSVPALSDGQRLMTAEEASVWCCRCLCGSARSFRMRVATDGGQEVMSIERPWTMCNTSRLWSLVCATCRCSHQRLVVYSGAHCAQPRQRLGSVHEEFGLNYIVSVKDADDTELYRIVGTPVKCLELWEIYGPGGIKGDQVVGRVRRYWDEDKHGRAVWDADVYEMEFPAAATGRHRMLLMGAVLFVDYLYFERFKGCVC